MHMHIQIHADIHYILTYLHTYLFTYLRTYVLTYLHTYILTHIHTHTYIHTYIHHKPLALHTTDLTSYWVEPDATQTPHPLERRMLHAALPKLPTPMELPKNRNLCLKFT